MIEEVLQFGATFDWISPVLAVGQEVANGPTTTFLIPYGDSGYSGHEIGAMLRRAGINSWGKMVINGTLTVSVPREHAARAQAVLERAGVPLENEAAPQAQPAQPQGGILDNWGW